MITFGRQVCGDLDQASTREWLVTDGLGGYAMGTVAGLRTRRYHGLLVVAAPGRRSAAMLGLAALDPVARARRPAGPARHPRVGRRRRRPGRARPPAELRASTTACRAGAGTSATSCWSGRSPWSTAARRSASCTASCAPRARSRLELEALCTWRDVHGERFGGGEPRGRRRSPTASCSRAPTGCAARTWQPGGEWYRGVHAPRGGRPRAERRSRTCGSPAGSPPTLRARRAASSVEAWAGDPLGARCRPRPTGHRRRGDRAGRGRSPRASARPTTSTGSSRSPPTSSSSTPTARPWSPATRGSATGRATR